MLTFAANPESSLSCCLRGDAESTSGNVYERAMPVTSACPAESMAIPYAASARNCSCGPNTSWQSVVQTSPPRNDE